MLPDRPNTERKSMSRTSEPTRPSLVWFRDDLRLADHAALRAAMAHGQQVLPVYVLDEASAGKWGPGGASRWWLHHSLAALEADLALRGAPLILRRGAAIEEIPRLAHAVGAATVHTSGAALPWARRLDRAVASALQEDGVTLTRHRTTMLFNPATLRTKAGGNYAVFTPFSRACFTHAPPPSPVSAPDRIASVSLSSSTAPAASKPPASSKQIAATPQVSKGLASDRLEAWALLPKHPDWAADWRTAWTPGEAGAQLRLREFLTDGLGGYAERRDIPGQEGTSKLSPHLAFGEISPAQIWHAATTALHAGSKGAERFLTELLWREFSHHLLWNQPDLPEQPLRPAFDGMPWRDDPAGLAAWQQGRTGIPIVDAGMRQLWQTGWMHNRVRMIVASFLVKHLLVPWRAGAAWFWDTLVDADLASNSAGWQWVAGSGADAAPYFRIFNPVLQGRKFDPDGAYVRHFVPELGQLDPRFIHAPWEAPACVLGAAGVAFGHTYPAPIVDLAAGRTRALAAFAALRDAVA